MQIQCPKCQGLNEIDDEHAGQVVACGHCGAHLRVPNVSRSAAPRARPGAASAGSARQPSAPRPSAPRQPAAADPGYEAIDEEPADEPPRPKRKKKKKRSFDYGDTRYDNPQSGVWIGALSAAFVWLVLVGLSFWFHGVTWILVVGGVILTVIGRWWFVGIAYGEDFHHGLMCMWVPFYSTYYFFTRLTDTLLPFLIGALGYLFLISGGVLWFTHFHRAALKAEKEANVAFENMDGRLHFKLAGKQHDLKVGGLFHFLDPKRQGVANNRIEVKDNQGTLIYGMLPNDFRGDWQNLKGKTIRFTPTEIGDPEATSEVDLGGGQSLAVLDGGLSVERVIGDAKIPVLVGKLRMKLSGDKEVEGTFSLPVHLHPDLVVGEQMRGFIDPDD